MFGSGINVEGCMIISIVLTIGDPVIGCCFIVEEVYDWLWY